MNQDFETFMAEGEELRKEQLKTEFSVLMEVKMNSIHIIRFWKGYFLFNMLNNNQSQLVFHT